MYIVHARTATQSSRRKGLATHSSQFCSGGQSWRLLRKVSGPGYVPGAGDALFLLVVTFLAVLAKSSSLGKS